MSEIEESGRSLWHSVKRSFHLDDYSKILNPDRPLPNRNSAAVQQFIASDPVHGPVLKAADEAANFAYVGAAVGAITTGGNAWRWSKSPHGTVLSFAFGAVVGFTLGAEAANHWYQLYRLDTVGAQVKFNEWLQKRA
ncbi:hypothetical protein SASPL_122079 [Salvia splendens]|uniref:Uncharacterized protein n=1 Tax=Salvia splendens TaxID=180675 RepID=A0A8X8XNM4_SALSN|nr:succinate dehydrogenase subunit 6, mitochondrial-like [Salvia splendens]KAG6414706.1 hypothetical protein SASPL_122079 [Salvia splendens]